MSDKKNDLKDISVGSDRALRALIALTCICVLVQTYSIPHKIMVLISVSNLVLSLSWLAYGVFEIVRRVSQRVPFNLIKGFGIVFFSLISLVIGLISDGSTTSQIGRLIGFLVLPLMICCISVTRVSDSTRRIVLVTNIVASIQYILLYYSDLRHAFDTKYGVQNIESVTLGFANPNQTAMMLFSSLILLFVAVFFFKNKILRLVLIADMAFLAFILFETDSRTATLLVAVFLVFVLIALKKRIPKIVTELCMLAPFAYLAVALAMAPLLSDLELLGDSLFTGRENIYARYFDNLNPISFLFGDIAEFKFENLHNAYISIAASVGIIVFLLYYTFIRKALLNFYGKGNVSGYSAVAYCGLLCVMIYSSAEGGFLVGGTTYGALIAMMFLMLPSNAEICESPQADR